MSSGTLLEACAPCAPSCANCAPCAEADGCEDGLSNQAAFVESALREWEELSAAHTIGGVVLYGATDSLFVLPARDPGAPVDEGADRLDPDALPGPAAAGARRSASTRRSPVSRRATARAAAGSTLRRASSRRSSGGAPWSFSPWGGFTWSSPTARR